MVQKGAKSIGGSLRKGKEHFEEEFLSSNSVGRGSTETDLEVFADNGDESNLISSTETLDGDK